MLKAIFFDNDGVLVSSEHLVYEANQIVLDDLKIPYSLEDFKDHTLHTNKGSAGFFAERELEAGFNSKFKELRKAIWNYKLAEKDHSIPNVEAILQSLNKHYILGLATSARQEHLQLGHSHDQLLSYFDFILTREDCTNIKPDPEIYLEALSKANVKANEALVIEDAPRGVAAGKAAGIVTIAIPHGFTTDMDFSNADYILKDISELPALINKLNS